MMNKNIAKMERKIESQEKLIEQLEGELYEANVDGLYWQRKAENMILKFEIQEQIIIKLKKECADTYEQLKKAEYKVASYEEMIEPEDIITDDDIPHIKAE